MTVTYVQGFGLKVIVLLVSRVPSKLFRHPRTCSGGPGAERTGFSLEPWMPGTSPGITPLFSETAARRTARRAEPRLSAATRKSLLRQRGRAHSKRAGPCEPGARGQFPPQDTPNQKWAPMRGKRRSCARSWRSGSTRRYWLDVYGELVG